MPFVRFSRDKRGYEHLYLVDAGKERGRARILYWFRTPPGVRVGRTPFDADTQKALERQNPGVHFDWTQIIAAKMPPPAPVENWREKRRVERAIKRARAEDAADSHRDLEEAAEEPLVETVEMGDTESTPDEAVEMGGAIGVAEVGEQRAPDEASAEAPVGPPGPGAGTRRRRRRRGRRRPGPETGPVSAPGNGGLDPPTSDVESSNEE